MCCTFSGCGQNEVNPYTCTVSNSYSYNPMHIYSISRKICPRFCFVLITSRFLRRYIDICFMTQALHLPSHTRHSLYASSWAGCIHRWWDRCHPRSSLGCRCSACVLWSPIFQGFFTGTGTIITLSQRWRSNLVGPVLGKIRLCETTTKTQQNMNRVHISWVVCV